MSINGYCDPKFSRVEEYFEKSINSKFELGASISIEIEGERVINCLLYTSPSPRD